MNRNNQLIVATGSVATAEVVECNCPDDCQRDHETD
jgi:hypothetical protein